MAWQAAADRAYLVDRLAQIPNVETVGRAEGPFVLVCVPDGLAVREALRRRGFAVRRADTFPGLGPEWLRIAVRDRVTTERFLGALRQSLTA